MQDTEYEILHLHRYYCDNKGPGNMHFYLLLGSRGPRKLIPCHEVTQLNQKALRRLRFYLDPGKPTAVTQA